MDDATEMDGQQPKKKLSRVKWFTFIFAAALIFLGTKIFLYARSLGGLGPEALDPAKLADKASAIGRLELVGAMAIGLGCLAAVVGVFGSVVRAPWVKLLEVLEALGFIGVGGFILATRGNLFGPALPIVLIVIGTIQGIVAFREYRKQHAR